MVKLKKIIIQIFRSIDNIRKMIVSLEELNKRLIDSKSSSCKLSIRELREDVKKYKYQKKNYPAERIKIMLPEIDDQVR